ncbi:MAG: zinc ribbon domain-containing protein [Chloroflexi bacterium]|nr:zinc ribbon domain-containing protein [Chloroflexota bacterium]
MRRMLALLLLAGILISAHPARAQSEAGFLIAQVKVWPEYDKPGVLVIYQLIVSPQTSLPAEMTFRIPKSAAKPNVVAIGPTLETVSDQNVDYSLEENGAWVNLIVQVTAPAIQLEYYDPTILINGTQRTFTYTWPGDYAVEKFSLELQQPFDASALNSAPNLPSSLTSPDGLTYYSDNFGSLPKGQEFSLEVSYQKASDALSVSFLTVQPSAPVDETTAGRVSLNTYLPWLLGVIGVAMIAGGAFYYFRSSAQTSRAARRRHRANAEKESVATYCSQCGARARSGDRFCRTCGSRLRVENEE